MTPFDPNKITFFAKTDARGQNVPFGIKAIDRQKHMYVIGKTGMGKSTLLENMAVQDIKNNEGMAFIDPHGATAETLLDYIPEERKDDVLYFAPFDMEHPVSFNVMEDVGADKRHLVVSGLMSVFEKIWVDAWSARMAYILQNTLMALLEFPDATLLGVNRMLSDKQYRKLVVDNITDPSVKSFWIDEFAKYNERYMQEAGDAIKNKIGQFTANPLIRNIIGQPKSSFSLRQIMDEQKILIMNLSKGLVGESNANLLGSMLTTRIYLAAMSRADLPQEQMRQMPNFYFYVDEFQSFANATFADILSEARKYKLNLTIAHQYIEQMEEEVRNAVFGNVGTIVAFRVGPFDAEVLETIFAPQFYAVDICNLGFAQIYLTLMIDGIGSQPFSAVTLPPIKQAETSCKDIIIHRSREQYAQPRAGVEEAIVAWHEQTHHDLVNENNASDRKKRSDNSSAQKSRSSENMQGRQSSAPRKEMSQQPDVPKDESRSQNRKDNSRRSESKPRQENQKQSSEKPSNKAGNSTKSVEDLRAVLAKLSEKERQPKPDQKQPENKKDNQQEKDTSPQKTDAALDLKQALQKTLTDQNTKAEHSKANHQHEQRKESSQGKAPEVQTPTLSTVSAEKDPLDPKALERMMRPKTSDKTPFK